MCREENESRAQRFSMVHVSFAKKEAALQQRADEAELAAEHLRQVLPKQMTARLKIIHADSLPWPLWI
jgi:septation ring formation regulator EzrA